MIKSFGDERTEAIFYGHRVKKIDTKLLQKIERRLAYIHSARKIDDLRIPPSNKLEKKKGDLKEFYAIWVNKQFRIIFKWKNGDAYEVQLVDYH
jgi:proteic killer suppression protein